MSFEKVLKICPEAQGEWTSLKFNYDADVIEELKDIIPADSREYDPKNKIWYVDPCYTLEVENIFYSSDYKIEEV